MARRVFFSFHYGRDVWRVNQVRHSWVAKPDREAAGFFDAAEQEEIKRATNEKIRRWINQQMQNTSVTVVLIGSETADRDWVHYEIQKSIERGNGIVGVRIHSLKDRHGSPDSKGSNPLKKFVVENGDRVKTLSSIYPTYDWEWDNGREKMGTWVEEAAQISDTLSNEVRLSVRPRESFLEGVNLEAGVGFLAGAGALYYIQKYTELDLLENIDFSQYKK